MPATNTMLLIANLWLAYLFSFFVAVLDGIDFCSNAATHQQAILTINGIPPLKAAADKVALHQDTLYCQVIIKREH